MSAVTVPSLSDPTAAQAAQALGGRWGRHAGVSRFGWWTPVRVLMGLTCVTLLLGFAQKSPCMDGDWGSHGMQYTHACYSDIVPLWSAERLDVGAVPYRDTAVEYPALTGGFMWLTAELTRGVTSLTDKWNDVLTFDVISVLLLAICALLIIWFIAMTARASGRQPYGAAIFALSPLLVFHAFTNWDLLAMAFTSGAIWAWATRRPVLAGVLIGLGTAAKLYPGLLVVALLIIAVRTRRWSPALWATGAAAASWATVNVPLALAYNHGWWEFYKFSMERPTERSTFWAIGRTLFTDPHGLDVKDAPFWVPPGLAVALLFVAGMLLVVWAGLRAPTTPRLSQLAFLVVLAFLLTTKVWSPQYSLWLVPLLALARPKWRLNLLWQFTEVAVWILTLTLLHGLSDDPTQSSRGISYGWLTLVLLVRDAMLLALAVLIVRDMWRAPDGPPEDAPSALTGIPDKTLITPGA